MGASEKFFGIGMKIGSKKQLGNLLKSDVYIADKEIPVFSHYASLATDTLVEIGAGLGASAILMLVNAPRGALVHSIDSFAGDSMKNFYVSEKRCRENVLRALNSLGVAKLTEYWHLYSQPSHQMASSWSNPIDFLYIDGDHRYEAVKQDFDDWFKHIKPNGVLLLHDSRKIPNTLENKFDRGWPGPTKLAEELKGRNDLKLINETYSLTVWRKNGQSH